MSYRVSPPNPIADRQAVLELWHRNLPDADDRRFDWLYDRGPAVSLVLRSADGEAVGSAGLMRRTLRAFGRQVQAAQAVDLNVDRQHRTAGPALALQRGVIDAARAADFALIYGFPNPQSEPVLRRAGYRALGPMSRWVKPLSARRLLNGLPPWLGDVATPCADMLWRLVSPETWRRLPAGLSVRRVGSFDERFDRLFEVAAGRLPIVGRRTSDYLAWRFPRRGPRRHHVAGLFDQADTLLAYVVWRWRRGTACVADLLAADPMYLDLVLADLLGELRRRGAEGVVLNYFGHPEVPRTLSRLGFWPRVLEWKAMVYANPTLGEATLERLLEPDHWYLTRADLDTDE